MTDVSQTVEYEVTTVSVETPETDVDKDVSAEVDVSKEVTVTVEPTITITLEMIISVQAGELKMSYEDYIYFLYVFGLCDGWGLATGTEMCIVIIGYDQPGNDILDKPLVFKSSAECCDACAGEKGNYLLTTILFILNFF